MSEPEYSKNCAAEIDCLERLLQHSLPVEFKVFLGAGADALRYKADECEWTFVAPSELTRFVQVGRSKKPYIRQLQGYSETIRRQTSADSVSLEGGGEMLLSRLAGGWAIAESGGDILFLDPGSDFSVWVFFHDGLTVRRVASSLYSWLCLAERQLPEPPVQQVPREVLKVCIEDALRDYVRHVLIPRGMIKSEDFLTSIAGHTVFNRKEGLVLERLAELITELHVLDPDEHRELRNRLFAEISQLGRLT